MSGARQTLRRPIDCRGVSLDWGAGARTLVMGILNVTPDSFSDGGQFIEVDAAIDRAGEMIEAGADIIDIGGESSRPAGATYGAGASVVSIEDEIARVVPVVKAVSNEYPDAVISVDTYKSQVARVAIDAGARMVNDITGFRGDDKMPTAVAEMGVPVVLMHSVGVPGQMPHEIEYQDVVTEVTESLSKSIQTADEHGIDDVIIDPGFGFGKSAVDNLRLIAELAAFCELGYPVLIGVSKKASIGAALADNGHMRPVGDRLFGSLAAAAAAILNGASIVRTHDVRATRDMANVLYSIERAATVPAEAF
jgi:dihydropteroate synthase